MLLFIFCFVLQALQRVPLFAGLDPKTKGAIASALGQVSMPKGTAVVTQVRVGLQFCAHHPQITITVHIDEGD
jgi:hypothetical protein